MHSKRKRYYHKTIVLKNVFSGTFVYICIIIFAVGILASAFNMLNIKVSKNYIYECFDDFFKINRTSLFQKPTVYDHIYSVIPAVKSGEEMMKKYSAKYSGVKKEKVSENHEEEINEIGDMKIKKLDMSSNGITFRNETAYVPELNVLLNTRLDFKIEDEKPKVLIVHTHTSEAYAESKSGRATDNEKNVVRVGTVIEERLRQHGIEVIHDITRNDYPAYNGSYTKALAGIKKNIEQNPSIEVVLDIHRDYAEQNINGEAVQLKPVTEIDDKPVAQVMFVVGTDGLGLSHPEWKHNLAFAVQVQSELDKISPKIARAINIRRERFNQHMTKGSVIIEMGTAGNTITECENAGIYVGDAIVAVLNRYKI